MTVPAVSLTDLTGVWGSAPDNVYAVGKDDKSRGGILHYNGATWRQLQGVPETQGLSSIWGTGPDDIYAVSKSAHVLHFDGKKWERWGAGGENEGVWASQDAGVFVIGRGFILHRPPQAGAR